MVSYKAVGKLTEMVKLFNACKDQNRQIMLIPA